MNNREFFNSLAHEWDIITVHNLDKLKNILAVIDLKFGDTVLDVGTDTGVMIPLIIDKVGEKARVVAIDIAEKMVEEAMKKYPFKNVVYIAGDVLQFEPAEMFDCVICYSMFPHFNNQLHAVKKLSSLLKKTGKLVVCHSQSRDEINHIHTGFSEPVRNDRLPAAESIAEMYAEAELITCTVVDDENMFIVIGKK